MQLRAVGIQFAPPMALHPLPVGQPRGRGTADRWCRCWGGWTVRSCWWPRVVVGNLPVGFASTHEQRKPGRTQGHDHKPQLEAQRRDRVRTVGASLHPWGVTGCRYASERGEPTGRSATPSHRTHRPAHHPINDTREASQLSDPSPHRGALQRQPQTRFDAAGKPPSSRLAIPRPQFASTMQARGLSMRRPAEGQQACKQLRDSVVFLVFLG